MQKDSSSMLVQLFLDCVATNIRRHAYRIWRRIWDSLATRKMATTLMRALPGEMIAVHLSLKTLRNRTKTTRTTTTKKIFF
jgi:hypothetical protein